MNKLKLRKLIKLLLPRRVRFAYALTFQGPELSGVSSRKQKFINILLKKRFVYYRSELSVQMAASDQIKQIVKGIKFQNCTTEPFLYPYDASIVKLLRPKVQQLVSLTLDYEKVLTLNLVDLSRTLSSNDDDFSRSVVQTIETIDLFRLRAIKYYSKRYDDRSVRLHHFLNKIMDTTPDTLEEALQKILFFNALQWVFGHRLVGLGRLDVILNPYFEKDRVNGNTREQAVSSITEFVKVLGCQTISKSGALVGDTGQVIIISGTDRQGKYVENELTHIFLEVIGLLNIPDPKLILRVCESTSDALWRATVACVSKGNGSPLMANEPKIMALMEDFGYDCEDTVDFGTSACWEPLIIGKSFDQNNSVENINLVKPLVGLIACRQFDSYNDFLSAYIEYLSADVYRVTKNNTEILFDCSPFMSIWTFGCIKNLTDISSGGAKYNFHGFLCSGLPNVVNSLLNIRRYVFEEELISYIGLRQALNCNFEGFEDLREKLMSNSHRFGSISPDVVSTTSIVMNCLSEQVAKTTINGHRAKIGFSSPAYLLIGKSTPASPDGRKAGDPFATHISPVSREVGFAEIIDFAGSLDYSGNKINGNVVDFILSKQFVKNSDKFIQILRVAFAKGVFEMQLNILNVEQLIKVRSNPSLCPNLVVRIWGFSAYFNDLPDSYKDMLIRRALEAS